MKQYVFTSTYQDATAELSFNGLDWNDNKNTNSNISDYKVSVFNNADPSVKNWERIFTSQVSPIHPWEKLTLCKLTKDHLIIGIGNLVCFIEPETGISICTFNLCNTPIIQLDLNEPQSALYILLQYQGFKPDLDRNRSNLYKMEFNKSFYSLAWSADLGNDNGLVKDFSITDFGVNINTTKRKELKVDMTTGKIIIP